MVSTTPASCRPELKMYWFGLPLGQNPPPRTGEFVGSTHSSPRLLMPQKTRFTLSTAFVTAKRFAARRRPGRSGPGFATRVAAVVADSRVRATAACAARLNHVERIIIPRVLLTDT